MSTIRPFPPKDGWVRRWLRQGAALCLHAPSIMVVALLGMFAIWLVNYAIDTGSAILFGARTALLEDVVYALAVPFGLPLALVLTALIAQADRGGRIDWAHIRALLTLGVPGLFLLHSFAVVLFWPQCAPENHRHGHPRRHRHLNTKAL